MKRKRIGDCYCDFDDTVILLIENEYFNEYLNMCIFALKEVEQ